MYRRTNKYEQQRAEAQVRAQATRTRNRMAGPAPDYPHQLPELRMRITIERFDFGEQRNVFELRRTRRVDCYAVTVNGMAWKVSGLSGVLEGVRKACPRVMSARACG